MSDCIETKCIHLPREEERALQGGAFGAVSFPIYQTAIFAHSELGRTTGYDYSRQTNPTREYLEKIIANMEGGAAAVGFSTGMAAITALMEIFERGDHLIIEADLYGGSIRLFEKLEQKNGLQFTALDLSEDDIEPYINEHTKAVFIETPTNPIMHVIDIEALAKVCKKHGLYLIVDNTFLSPYLQNPIKLGADIVVHSGTKYLGGHNDALSGFLVAGTKELGEQFHTIAKSTGGVLSPFDSWLVLRGIKTISVRMDRACENAAVIADWLKQQEIVTDVYYPGLPEHPGHEIMKRQAKNYGGMISFKLRTEQQAVQLLKELELIQFAESFGGPETLLTYPLTQTHADVSKELREKNGLDGRLLRMSVGLENVQDILADLAQAFGKLK